jgi:hypothetical protein
MYSIDLAYLEYFKCLTTGKYATNFFTERLTAFLIAIFLNFISFIRIFARITYTVTECLKVIFYLIATLCSLKNAGRLTDHIKLSLISALALGAHSIQLFIHILSVFMALIRPSISYRMMRETFNSLDSITAIEDKLWNEYETPVIHVKISAFVKMKLTSLFENCSWPVKIAMKTIINEFSHAFDAGLVAPLGFMDKFHLFSANPEFITEEQKKLDPILLLNGNYSHQATFLPLLYKLKKSGNKRPVYTVNLPPNCKDINFILNKVKEIKKHYSKTDDVSLNLDMVGHSMGAFLIQQLLQSQDVCFVNRVITIGTPCFIEHLFHDEKIFDITAKDDLIICSKSQLKQSQNKIEVNTGHLGLLFHKKSLQAIQHFLQV